MGAGLASFQKRFQAIPQEVRESIAPSLLKAGGEVADTIRALAPKDEGALAASVAVTPAGATTPAYSQPGGQLAVPEGAVAVTAGNAEVRYPHMVEFGTVKMGAKPFFWPGFRMTRQKAVGLIQTGFRRALKGQK